jgi:hypothetical protein
VHAISVRNGECAFSWLCAPLNFPHTPRILQVQAIRNRFKDLETYLVFYHGKDDPSKVATKDEVSWKAGQDLHDMMWTATALESRMADHLGPLSPVNSLVPGEWRWLTAGSDMAPDVAPNCPPLQWQACTLDFF